MTRRLSLVLSIVFCFLAFVGPDSVFTVEGPSSANSLEEAASAINSDASTKKNAPEQLFLSSFLPVIADGQTLKLKVAEARRIILRLDQETQSAKKKLPAVTGVFEPIHLGLAKPAKPDEYGGGMTSRLEFIEKNLSKSLQSLARLPSSCEGAAKAQWRAAVAGQQLLLKTITQAKQAQIQATWTAKESDKLIQAALQRLRGANDKASVQELESYDKKLQSALISVAKILDKALEAKGLGKKSMPKLGAECGSDLALGLPSKKDANMQLEAAASKTDAAKTTAPTSSATESAKGTGTPKNAGGNILGAAAVPSPLIAKASDIDGVSVACAKLMKSSGLEQEVLCKKYWAGQCCCPSGQTFVKGKCKAAGFDFSKLLEGIDKFVRNNPFVRWTNDLSDKMWQWELEGIKKAVDGVKKLPGYIDKAQKAWDEAGRWLRDETEPCGKDWYNPKKACCSGGKLFPGQVPIGKGKCGCPPGKTLKADGTCEEYAVKLKEVSFSGAGFHPVRADDNSATYTSSQWQVNKQFPVCYTRNAVMTVSATFTITPKPKGGEAVKVQGTGPSGIKFPETAISLTASNEFKLPFTASAALPKTVAFFESFAISWQAAVGGAGWVDAGTSRNPAYVTLADPLTAGPNHLFQTALFLATSKGKAADQAAAVKNTWKMFAEQNILQKSVGPKNIKTWDGRPLNYYPSGTPPADCALDSSSLLASGNGQCGSFAFLFMDALAANGIGSSKVMVDPASGADRKFLVKDWKDSRAASFAQETPAYPWKLEFSKGSEGTFPLRPGNNVYGDWTSLDTLAGQNTKPPAEKVFYRHYIVEQGKNYYDPSYGQTYSNAADFEKKAVAGYAMHDRRDDPNIWRVRKPSGPIGVKFTPPGP